MYSERHTHTHVIFLSKCTQKDHGGLVILIKCGVRLYHSTDRTDIFSEECPFLLTEKYLRSQNEVQVLVDAKRYFPLIYIWYFRDDVILIKCTLLHLLQILLFLIIISKLFSQKISFIDFEGNFIYFRQFLRKKVFKEEEWKFLCFNVI